MGSRLCPIATICPVDTVGSGIPRETQTHDEFQTGVKAEPTSLYWVRLVVEF